MKTITVPSADQVSDESRVLFDQLKKRLGKVPNLYATMGYSSHALKGFLDFEAGLNGGQFSAKEREAIALVVSEVNQCAYCLASHTRLAILRGFSNAETLDVRRGQVSDVKLNAIVQLAKSIAENKGHADERLLNNFYEQGYTEAALMELTGLVAVRVYTNYVFALTAIPVDFPAAESLQ
jgi:uncharacterized peroxidase-related enzyme